MITVTRDTNVVYASLQEYTDEYGLWIVEYGLLRLLVLQEYTICESLFRQKQIW